MQPIGKIQRRSRRGFRRALAVLCSVLILAPLVLVTSSAPAAAAAGPAQGIQFGWPFDLDTCERYPTVNLMLSNDTLQAATNWVRIDFRGAGGFKPETPYGCTDVAGRYQTLLSDLAVEVPQAKIIGLLSNEFLWGYGRDVTAAMFSEAARNVACSDAYAGVDFWEVWNEPTYGDTSLTAAQYAEMLGLTSRALRDCGKKVISGGINPQGDGVPHPIEYLDLVNAEFETLGHGGYSSLGAAVDGIGMHPYVTSIGEEPAVHTPILAFIGAFEQAFPNEGLYITEFGWPMGVVTDVAQCNDLVQAFRAIAGHSQVKAATWFTLADFGVAGQDYGLYTQGHEARRSLEGYVDGTCGAADELFYDSGSEQLLWQSVPSPTTTYEVALAKSSDTTFTHLKTVSDTKVALAAFSPPLTADTYKWKVTTIKGGVRIPSAPVLFTYLGKPAAPSAVGATPQTASSVVVSWLDNANNETGFEITNGTTTTSVPANASNHTWGGLAAGSTTCFQVRAVNLQGVSAWTNPPVCATTPTPPAAPSNVTATVATGTSVLVSWQDNSSNENGFEISDGSTSDVVTTNTTSYTWPGIAAGTQKCFKVRAYNIVAGYSAWTTPSICATTPTIPIAPTTPTAVVVSGTSINVGWVDKSSNEFGFEISNGSTSKVVGPNATSYVWTGLANGTSMCFKVRSYNLAGYSAWTASKCATTPTIPIMPASPVASVVSGTSIKLAWVDKSSNETGFEISNGATSKVVGANAVGYTWTGLANGTTTCLRVRSYNLAGYSAWSAYSCATTPTIPIAPTIVSAVAVSTSQIKITWTDRSSNETMFQVYNQMSFVNVGANLTSYTWSGIAPNTTMCFNVRSYNLAGSSAPTPYVCATTPGPPLAPSNQAAVPISSSVIKVTWTDRSNNETGFWVYDGVATVHVPANQPYYYKSGLTSGTYKCFSVAAYNSYGQSAFTPYACTYTY